MRQSGFTLIELLVVVSIIAVLAAMLLPAISAVRAAAHTARCASNLRNVNAAILAYTDENNGLFPPINKGAYPGDLRSGNWTHPDFVGGYLEEDATPGVATRIRSVFTCPSDKRWQADGWSVSTGFGFFPFGANYCLLNWVVDPTGVFSFERSMSISRVGKKAITPLCLDARTGAFHPGFTVLPTDPPPCFGNFDADTAITWDFGTPTSNYNYARRHRGGCNIAYVDGHCAYVADLHRQVAEEFGTAVKFWQ